MNYVKFIVTWTVLLLSFNLSLAFVKAQNAVFVNSAGKEVFLRGVGLGGWLVPEGYMLHFPGFGSPTYINTQIVDVIGEQNAQLFWKNYRQNYVNEEDIAKIAQLGYNSIRLPFNYRLLSPEQQSGVYLEDGFALIDRFIAWCSKYHLYVILDMHCAPGGQNADNISDSDGQEARLWTDESNRERTVDIWQHIAQRYANDTTIIGYDLLNEPVLPQGHPANELRSLYIRISNAIRQVDQNHIIFVEGNWYATDFTALTPPWDTNMAYSFHKYWNDTSVATIQDYLNIRKTYRLPLWMGESGENSNHWFASVVQMLEANDVSWCWWTHKKFATTTSPYSAPLPAGFQTLVDYWNGQADKPNQSYALSVLMQFTENLKLEHCRYLPDVRAALFDSTFLQQSKPFTTLTIPGTIACVDYDLGGNGIAYSDKDYARFQFEAYTPWNRGGAYRNDGVDIELSKDAAGPDFSVGWIEPDEWLAFTVNITESGTYDVIIRFAANSGNGKLRLFLDEQPVSDVESLPQTGGWYSWDTIRIHQVSLPGGSHRLVLKFINGGFNIDQLQFINVSDMGSITQPPQNFELGQNYPNPFNQNTRIPYFSNSTEKALLEIFDLSGKRIFSAKSTTVEKGKHSFLWKGIDLNNKPVSSGIYFYRVRIGSISKTKKMICLR